MECKLSRASEEARLLLCPFRTADQTHTTNTKEGEEGSLKLPPGWNRIPVSVYH